MIMSCKGCFAIDCSRPLRFIRKYSRSKERKIVLMLVGLDNAGKSSTAKGLAREPVESVVPTVGFNSVKLKHRGFSVIIYDLGGSSQIRGIWHRYFVDVHGIIFVVDASDLSRIDESRKVLEEMLAHEKVAGKPLLLLANKQDQDGALDELDIVERLNVESLVNQQKCPTLVETCAAAGAPSGSKAKLDPGILNGYRWLLRRIISEYDKLNSRVEQDTEEQRVLIETARQEWLRRQDTEQQVDSLPSEYEENPFKPIESLVKVSEQNGHIFKVGDQSNGHIEPLSLPVSEDSPDSSSHTVGEDSVHGVYIPLHSPTHLSNSHTVGEDSVHGVYIPLHSPTHLHKESPPHPTEPDILVISHPQPANVVMAVKEQFEWKMQKQKRKLLMRRSNRTAPSSAGSVVKERALPPLRTPKTTCSWARPGSAKSLPSQGWGLNLSLEEVDPPTSDGSDLKVEVVQSAKTLASTDSDDEDVICPVSIETS